MKMKPPACSTAACRARTQTADRLKIEADDLDAPGAGQVLVKVAASGLCRSDLSTVGEPPAHAFGCRATRARAWSKRSGPASRREAGDHVVFIFVPNYGRAATARRPRRRHHQVADPMRARGELLTAARGCRLDGEPIAPAPASPACRVRGGARSWLVSRSATCRSRIRRSSGARLTGVGRRSIRRASCRRRGAHLPARRRRALVIQGRGSRRADDHRRRPLRRRARPRAPLRTDTFDAADPGLRQGDLRSYSRTAYDCGVGIAARSSNRAPGHRHPRAPRLGACWRSPAAHSGVLRFDRLQSGSATRSGSARLHGKVRRRSTTCRSSSALCQAIPASRWTRLSGARSRSQT